MSGTGFQFEPTALSPLQNWSARAKGRTNPLNNFVDDITWTKGKHTITAGLNFRYNQNNICRVYQLVPALCVRRHGTDRTGRRYR